MRRQSALLLATLAVTAAAAVAQQRLTFTVPVPDETKIDSYFVTAASDANLAEILAGRTAANKSNNDAVKQLAQVLVDHHSRGESELRGVGANLEGTMDNDTDPMHKVEAIALNKLSGARFDLEWAEAQVKDHRASLSLFKAQAQNGRNAQLKAWAQKQIPILEEHLASAEKLYAQLSKK